MPKITTQAASYTKSVGYQVPSFLSTLTLLQMVHFQCTKVMGPKWVVC